MTIRLKEERLKLILQAIQDDGHVTVVALSRSLDVSEVTIRRDLRELAGQGLLRRAHGEAVRRHLYDNRPQETRAYRSG